MALFLKGDSSWVIYDLQERKLLHEGYVKDARAMALHPDGRNIAITDSKGVIHFIDLCNNEEIAAFETKIPELDIIDISENGTKLVVASTKAKIVQVWDLRKEKATKQLDLDSDVERVAFD